MAVFPVGCVILSGGRWAR